MGIKWSETSDIFDDEEIIYRRMRLCSGNLGI